MKRFVLLFIFQALLAASIFSQTTSLMIKSNEKGFYLEHGAAAKENFYSIGRLFSVHPRTLAAFNGLDMSKGLSLGQVIKIPLTDTNFSQKVSKGVPVYYKTGEKEGLFRVSSNNNKVTMENLRKWNHLENDNIPEGTNLVVGYLVAGEIQNMAVTGLPKTETVTPPVVQTKKEEPRVVVAEPEKKKEEKPTIVKEEPKKTETNLPSQNTNNEVGYFKNYFDQQIRNSPVSKDMTVTSGIFKTASGWQDTKYYLLIDNVDPGVIVKITNPANGKMVFAKVLGEMSGIRQNQGLNVRISNAAASVLNVEETDKFIVKVNY